MKVEIWSDVMCPFCYIGKRRFEQALEKFDHNTDIKIEWRSFQLNPSMQTNPDASINEYLADAKGWSVDQARQMNQRVTNMAQEVGLTYDFDQAVVANSFDAHRLIQFAKTMDKGDQAEEALFHAYFTGGKNIADHETLMEIASEIGLEADDVEAVLESDQFANAVKHDIEIAKGLDIKGVPFYLFDRKYAVSGAQETEIFLKALNQAYGEWHEGAEKTADLSSD
ncbi:MAG TPA: DsbA family oxidoreductase [Balneolaceae bacterium]|nr:DsbA family oxidoreductase [Balneolaceae bacterium]